MKLFPSRRTVKRFAFGCALLVGVLLVVNAFMSWRVQRQADALIAEIRAAGDPATLADLKPEPIPDEENAAYWLKQARPKLLAFFKDYSEFVNSDQGKFYDERDRGTPLTAQQADAIAQVLAVHKDLNGLLAKAASCENYASTADFSVGPRQFIEAALPEIQPLRGLVLWHRWQIETLAAQNRHAEALNIGIQGLRLARLTAEEPLLVNYFPSVAMHSLICETTGDVLSAEEISSDLRQQLESELLISDSSHQLTMVLKAERAYCLSHLSASSVLELCSPDGYRPGAFERALNRLFQWRLKQFTVIPAEFIGRVLKAIPSSGLNRGSLLDNPIVWGPNGVRDPYVQLVASPVITLLECYNRRIAETRALRIINALQWHDETTNRVATRLANLDLPNDVTTDPYTGEPMKCKHTDHGWVVYSVGKNGVDDGGHVVEYADIGYAPPAVRLEQSKKQ